MVCCRWKEMNITKKWTYMTKVNKKWVYQRVYFVFESDRGSYIVVGRNTVVYSHIHSSWGFFWFFFPYPHGNFALLNFLFCAFFSAPPQIYWIFSVVDFFSFEFVIWIRYCECGCLNLKKIILRAYGILKAVLISGCLPG